jgi:hypothetical protein
MRGQIFRVHAILIAVAIGVAVACASVSSGIDQQARQALGGYPVQISTPITNDIVTWNGKAFVNAATPGGGTVQPANGGTGLTSYTAGDMLYASGATTLAKLAGGAGNNGKVLTVSGGLPSWQAASSLAQVLAVGNATTGHVVKVSDGDVVRWLLANGVGEAGAIMSGNTFGIPFADGDLIFDVKGSTVLALIRDSVNSTNTLLLGDSTASVASCSIKSPDAASGTNHAATSLEFAAGQSSGNGTPATITGKVTQAGASGTSTQSYVNAFQANRGSFLLGGAANGAALSGTATDGYAYGPNIAGVESGTATSVTGGTAFHYDTTNHQKLYRMGSKWCTGQPVCAQIAFSGSQNLVSGVAQTAAMSTTNFDPSGLMTGIVSNRIAIPIDGIYMIECGSTTGSVSATYKVSLTITKNGSSFATYDFVALSGSAMSYTTGGAIYNLTHGDSIGVSVTQGSGSATALTAAHLSVNYVGNER